MGSDRTIVVGAGLSGRACAGVLARGPVEDVLVSREGGRLAERGAGRLIEAARSR